MIQNNEVRGIVNHSKLSDSQKKFLEVYEETLDINKSATEAGLAQNNILRALRASTPFATLFRKLTADIDSDPRFNKIGSLSSILKLKKKAEEEGRLDLVLKCIQEWNKMIEGNIAATKKVVENVDIKVGAVIDLTTPINTGEAIDISHEELG